MSIGIGYTTGARASSFKSAPTGYIKHGALLAQDAWEQVGMTAYPTGRGAYFPAIVNARQLVNQGVLTLAPEIADANYLMYVSEDHGTLPGIWMATAPTIYGPWTVYNGSAGDGRIYISAGSGQETPEVFWSYHQNCLIMISHNVGLGVQQSSRLSYSTDGLNWDEFDPDIVLDLPTTDYNGPFTPDGHTGYIKHLRLPNGQSMFNGVCSGTTNSRRITWYSRDDLLWETTRGLMSLNTEGRYSDVEDWGVIPYKFAYHYGQLYGIAVHQGFTSGAGATTDGQMWVLQYEAPSSDIIRTPGKPILVIPRGESGAIDDLFFLSPSLISDNGKLFVYGTCRQEDATLDKNYIYLIELL